METKIVDLVINKDIAGLQNSFDNTFNASYENLSQGYQNFVLQQTFKSLKNTQDD